jgi:ABC-type polysaccharide/polyol phosphate transport system ATPase subunit
MPAIAPVVAPVVAPRATPLVGPVVAKTRLTLDRVGVEFPIYQTSARSLKRTALQTLVGGVIGASDGSGCTVIQALHDVSIDLRPGDRVALMGHNGAGKTTLLRVLADIYQPTSGTFSGTGKRAALFDLQVGVDEEATGYECIQLRGLMLGIDRGVIQRKAAEIAAFSELGDYLNLPMRTYSSGMLMRLFFSIATCVEADIVLMDEWISVGDEHFVEKANKRLHALIDRANILVIASHNRSLVNSLCNRGILLEGGRVARDGPLDAIFSAYNARQSA